MSTVTQICNRALSDIGSRVLITDFDTDTTPAARQCQLWYNTMRQQLLQAAPWSFARKTVALTLIGLLTDDPPASIYPWLAKYEYPADCLRMNYILPPPLPPAGASAPDVSGGPYSPYPWLMPSRQFRFLPSYDTDDADAARQVILANIEGAYGVYVVDVVDPAMFSASFELALSAAMAYKMVMPLTGNAGMKTTFAQIAEAELVKARVWMNNEAISSSDHVVDWMATREITGSFIPGGNYGGLGNWYCGYDSMSWGE